MLKSHDNLFHQQQRQEQQQEQNVVNGVNVKNALEWKRAACIHCGKRSTWFCPECLVLVGVPEDVNVPEITLPLNAIILRQASQKKKGTGSHAKILVPKQVELIDVGQVSMEERKKGVVSGISTVEDFVIESPVTSNNCVILFPSKHSILFNDLNIHEVKRLKYMIFIDSSWNSTQAIIQSNQLKHMKHVRLSCDAPMHSRYWRVPPEGKYFLSTIEAMAIAYKEFCSIYHKLNETGKVNHTTEGDEEKQEQTNQLMYIFENILKVIQIKRKEKYGDDVIPVNSITFRKLHRKKWYPNGARKNKRRKPQTVVVLEPKDQERTKEIPAESSTISCELCKNVKERLKI